MVSAGLDHARRRRVRSGDMESPSELDALLDEVRGADRATRIELRDRVAAHGLDATEPMAEWLDDAEFSRFVDPIFYGDPTTAAMKVLGLS